MAFGIPTWVRKFDWVLLVLVLTVIGLGMFTFYQSGTRWPQIIEKQAIALGIGLVLLFAVALVDYRVFRNYSFPSILLYIIAIILLLGALVFPPIRGSKSWITFGGYAFQPSEFAKLAVLILLAKYFSQKHAEIYRTHHILASAVYVGLPAVLTILQPDLGSMLIFVALWLAMLLFAGIKRKHLFVILMLGLVVMTLAWFFGLKAYQKDRIISFIDPYVDPRGIGYNIIQAQTTFGSGRLTGNLFAPPDQKLRVLVPEQYTDFAFASFGQKFGLVGVVGLFGLLIAIMLRIGNIGARAGTNFPKLFSLGLVMIIAIHIFMNAGMSMGVLPITGIPFSFLSYGGSHLITLLIGIGLMESIKIRG